MKIFLIQAFIGNSEPPVFPLGLSHIAAAMKGHQVEVFDPNAARQPFAALKVRLARFQPDLIGISIRNIDSTNKRRVVFYYTYLKQMLDAADHVLDARPRILVGGAGFSMFAREIMEDEPRIDFGVCGEGERAAAALIDQLDHPENVNNVFYRRNGRILFSGPKAPGDLDGIPFADRYFIDLEPYRRVPDAFGIETKRGCSFKCIYCPYGYLNGRRYRYRNPKRVVDEIDYLVHEKNVNRFTFIDSVFNYPLTHAEEICREMISRDLKTTWSAWFHDRFITPKFARLARAAGCRLFILSPDGFSEKSLRRLGKRQTMQDVLRAFHILRQIDGIEISYNFFKNPPGQSLGAFLRLILFALKAKMQLKGAVHFEFNSIRIEPNTELHRIAINEKMIASDDSLLFPVKYSNPKTRYIETLFDCMLKLKGK